MAQTWKKVIIRDHCEITSSKRIFAADYQKEGVPFYRSREVIEKHNGSVDVRTELFIAETKFTEIEAKFGAPTAGELLLTSVGTLGVPYLVKAGERFYFKDGNLTWFRKFKDLDSRFLYYWLLSPQGKGELKKCTIGSSLSAFTIVLLKGMEIDLPPLPVQRRITAILSAYDDLIENNLRRIKILEEMARTLYREWFVEFRFPGHIKVPCVASAIGPIPRDWTASTLSSLVDTQYGYTESTNQEPVGPKYLRGMDINKSSYIDWSEVPYCPISSEKVANYRLKKGDVVVIRMADPGKVGIVEQDVDAVFASYLIRVVPKDDRLGPYFLFYLMDSKAYQDYISGASTGTTRKSASAGVVTGFDFVLPPKPLVALFEQRVTPARQLLTNLLLQNANLRQTRDLLLPRLLSGQVPSAEAVLGA